MRRGIIFVLAAAIACGLAAGQVAKPPQATLALVNGRIWTGNPAQPWAQAVAINGEKIIAVGSNAQIAAVSNAQTKRVDLGGAFAMPGFNDAHIHFGGGALRLTQLDLNDANSLAEMQSRLKRFAAENPTAQWIQGYGWQYSWIPGGLPTRQNLDKIVADRPVYLAAYDGHTGWANSKALELAGVNAQTKYAGYGEVVRDAGGEPTGVLKEGAQGLVRRKIPSPTREQELDALRRGLKLAASLGITSIQNAHGDRNDLELYKELLDRGELTLRVGVAMSVRPATTQADLEKIAGVAREFSGSRLRVGAIKIVADGVIESHTVAMLAPYADRPDTSGNSPYTQEQLNNIVAWADAKNLQVYIHAIGDRAVRMALDAFEHAAKTNGKKDSRFRIEHIETIAAADIPRFAKLGVLASMMPIHADPGTNGMWLRAAGQERGTRAFVWQRLLRAGATVVFSSDWPAAISVSPIRALHCAVNRQTTDGKPPGGWMPDERVPLDTALSAYTRGGAFAEFQEKSLGTIEAGKLADLIVLSADPFKMKSSELHTLRVVQTIFNGQAVHNAAP